ncbi:MAG TPA: prephenate dehydrogenase [Anaerolineales bacterium]|nr:prephenate dehydrogenase [Anaerolineales bacterium]HNN14276.1 prephenate dehydrogenase [Anaerolineales bacterium]
MTVQITIIGLGQIGASVGLALAAHRDKVTTIGHDKDFSVEQRARKLGAVDVVNHNLPSAVEKADVVILALPVDQIRDTFGYIAQDLKKDAVVIDTAPVKAEVEKWAADLLPKTVHYVGLVPSIAAEYLDLTGTGLDSAKADLFSKSIFLLSAPSGTPGEAVKLASDLVDLMGASVMLTDFVESDGLMASVNLLPRLTAAALLNTTMDQPGWQEARKAASLAYFRATAAFSASENASAVTMLARHNKENVVRLLNQIIISLVDLRDDLEENEDAFKTRLESAQRGRDNWLLERSKADWLQVSGGNVEKVSLLESLLGSKLGKMGKRSNNGE